MAPAVELGLLCDLVGVDGPLLQILDRPAGIRYPGGYEQPLSAERWGLSSPRAGFIFPCDRPPQTR
jgi:hypothetical protein